KSLVKSNACGSQLSRERNFAPFFEMYPSQVATTFNSPVGSDSNSKVPSVLIVRRAFHVTYSGTQLVEEGEATQTIKRPFITGRGTESSSLPENRNPVFTCTQNSLVLPGID